MAPLVASSFWARQPSMQAKKPGTGSPQLVWGVWGGGGKGGGCLFLIDGVAGLVSSIRHQGAIEIRSWSYRRGGGSEWRVPTLSSKHGHCGGGMGEGDVFTLVGGGIGLLDGIRTVDSVVVVWRGGGSKGRLLTLCKEVRFYIAGQDMVMFYRAREWRKYHHFLRRSPSCQRRPWPT